MSIQKLSKGSAVAKTTKRAAKSAVKNFIKPFLTTAKIENGEVVHPFYVGMTAEDAAKSAKKIELKPEEINELFLKLVDPNRQGRSLRPLNYKTWDAERGFASGGSAKITSPFLYKKMNTPGTSENETLQWLLNEDNWNSVVARINPGLMITPDGDAIFKIAHHMRRNPNLSSNYGYELGIVGLNPEEYIARGNKYIPGRLVAFISNNPVVTAYKYGEGTKDHPLGYDYNTAREIIYELLGGKNGKYLNRLMVHENHEAMSYGLDLLKRAEELDKYIRNVKGKSGYKFNDIIAPEQMDSEYARAIREYTDIQYHLGKYFSSVSNGVDLSSGRKFLGGKNIDAFGIAPRDAKLMGIQTDISEVLTLPNSGREGESIKVYWQKPDTGEINYKDPYRLSGEITKLQSKRGRTALQRYNHAMKNIMAYLAEQGILEGESNFNDKKGKAIIKDLATLRKIRMKSGKINSDYVYGGFLGWDPLPQWTGVVKDLFYKRGGTLIKKQ